MSILNVAWPTATKLQIYFTIYQIYSKYFPIKNFRNESRINSFYVSKIIYSITSNDRNSQIIHNYKSKNDLSEYILINRFLIPFES